MLLEVADERLALGVLSRTEHGDLHGLSSWLSGGDPSEARGRSGHFLTSIGDKMGSVANTSSRTLRLLSLLQSQRYWPGSELADRLAVSVRTLRRDVDRLRELGYPV